MTPWLEVYAVFFLSAPLAQAVDVAPISRANVEARAGSIFAMLDADENGVLTREEFERVVNTVVETNIRTRELMKRVFVGLDKDGDGWVGVAEFNAALTVKRPVNTEALLTRADTDHDGKLAFAEFEALLVNSRVATSAKLAFDKLDIDHDSYLTPAELDSITVASMQAQAAERRSSDQEFQRLDADRDGRLSAAEYLAILPPLKQPKRIDAMATYDANRDGKVSPAEFTARALAAFDAMDTNRDGVIDGGQSRPACTTGYGSATFLDPSESSRLPCAGKPGS